MSAGTRRLTSLLYSAAVLTSWSVWSPGSPSTWSGRVETAGDGPARRVVVCRGTRPYQLSRHQLLDENSPRVNAANLRTADQTALPIRIRHSPLDAQPGQWDVGPK